MRGNFPPIDGLLLEDREIDTLSAKATEIPDSARQLTR